MIEIVPAARDEYEAALALLFDRLPAAEQQASIADVLKALRGGRIALHGLLTAHVETASMVGSILYMLQADRTAFVWPPATSLGRIGAGDRRRASGRSDPPDRRGRRLDRPMPDRAQSPRRARNA